MAMPNEVCTWREDCDGTWEGSCGFGLVFLEGEGPEDSGMNYCPNCGQPVTAVEYQDENDD